MSTKQGAALLGVSRAGEEKVVLRALKKMVLSAMGKKMDWDERMEGGERKSGGALKRALPGDERDPGKKEHSLPGSQRKWSKVDKEASLARRQSLSAMVRYLLFSGR